MYGSSSLYETRDLWSSLISWGVCHDDPWMLLGDFNSTLHPDERQGSLDPIAAERVDFLSCATALGLEDSASTGNFFTWTNNTVWSKIHRVLLNQKWHVNGIVCLSEFLDFNTSSDHTTVVVNLAYYAPPAIKPF